MKPRRTKGFLFDDHGLLDLDTWHDKQDHSKLDDHLLVRLKWGMRRVVVEVVQRERLPMRGRDEHVVVVVVDSVDRCRKRKRKSGGVELVVFWLT